METGTQVKSIKGEMFGVVIDRGAWERLVEWDTRRDGVPADAVFVRTKGGMVVWFTPDELEAQHG